MHKHNEQLAIANYWEGAYPLHASWIVGNYIIDWWFRAKILTGQGLVEARARRLALVLQWQLIRSPPPPPHFSVGHFLTHSLLVTQFAAFQKYFESALWNKKHFCSHMEFSDTVVTGGSRGAYHLKNHCVILSPPLCSQPPLHWFCLEGLNVLLLVWIYFENSG